MLALKDESNICPATVPSLAKLSNLTIAQCEKYLHQFQQPDKYSRSQDFDGRRIEQIDGGWLILNGQKYRDLLRGQERRDYIRQKVAAHRERVNRCKQSKQSKPIAEAEAKAEADKKKKRWVLPSHLDASLESAWNDWQEHREEIRHPLTEKAALACLKRIEEFGTERARMAIEHSIAGGYRGIFEPTGKQNHDNKEKRPALTTAEYLRGR